ATGLWIAGGAAEVADVEVIGGQRGIRVEGGGTLAGDRVTCQRPTIDGVSMQEAEATLIALRVTGAGSTGLALNRGSRLHLREAVIDGAGRIGALVSDADLQADGLQVLDATERGLSLLRATARLDGLEIRRAGNVGVQITDAAGDVTLGSGVIADCATSGVAIFGDSGAITLGAMRVEGTVAGEAGLAEGVHIFQAQATLQGTEVRGNGGAGVLVEQAVAVVRDAVLAENTEPGLVALDAPQPIIVERTEARSNGGAGFFFLGGEATLDDCTGAENRLNLSVGPGHGAAAAAGAQLTVIGGAYISNVGNGLSVEPGAQATASGARFAGNGRYGVEAACDAFSEPEPNAYAENGAGDRGGCR
ncbi:MAG: right-handed parallel beta-helix repeat-containing protein, partial [Myxococcales bacterium]|nr:right-handed parallel beta-helix repeat-containing protein [Myxococcales bacterium]